MRDFVKYIFRIHICKFYRFACTEIHETNAYKDACYPDLQLSILRSLHFSFESRLASLRNARRLRQRSDVMLCTSVKCIF